MPTIPRPVSSNAGGAGRFINSSQAHLAESGGLLEPFQEEDEDEYGKSQRNNFGTLPRLNIGTSFAGAMAPTNVLSGIEEGCWEFGSPTTPQRSDPRLTMTSTPPESPSASGSESAEQRKRRRFLAPAVTEMGWLSGRTRDLEASTRSSGTSSNGTIGTRTGTGSNGSGSGRSGPRGTVSYHVGSGNRDSRGSQGTSTLDASPNMSELFYSRGFKSSFLSFGH
jgi:hypothetical protein